MPADANRDYRLLNASIAATSVRKNNYIDTTTPYYAKIQLAGQPRTFVSGERDINACFVGETSDNGLIIAFRGTLGPEEAESKEQMCLDWTQDRDYSDEMWTVGSGSAMIRRGNVATGFATALKSLWNEGGLGRYLIDMPIGRRPYIWLTGHSKGGAMAILAATWTWPESLGRPHVVVTSGQPKVLKDGFNIDLGGGNLDGITTRYQFQYDIVPEVPDIRIPGIPDADCPALGDPFGPIPGFMHVGELVFTTFTQGTGYGVAAAGDIQQAKITAAANLARLSPPGGSAVRGAAHNPKGDYLLAFNRG